MYKVFDLYQKLQELGYYYSCSKSTIKPFMCSNSKDTIDRLVNDTQVVVEKWRQKVSDLRICHNWLLYFCMPKLMHLYRLIESSVEVERVDLIIHEVSFLTTNSATDLDNLREVCIIIILGKLPTQTAQLLPQPLSFLPKKFYKI